jgi:tripartite-type tricarboxylate transporter receptor subunit TctC
MSVSRLRVALVALGAGLAMTAAGASGAAAADPFYKGKRLTVLINFAPGGPTDIEGRLFAKYIGRHIDGKPSIVVQNKDGAGGLVGSSYLGELGPKDGTMVGYLTGSAWKYVIDPSTHRVDFRTYEFIGYQPGNAVYYVRTDVQPGMKTNTDIMKAKGLVAGGLATDSSKDLLIRVTLDMLGVPYKYVTGYRSSNTARLALQRGEIGLHSETTPGYFSVVEPTMVKTGMVIPLYYDPLYDGETFSAPKVMQGSPIPTFPEFYKKVKGGTPSGIRWDVYRANLAVDSAMLRTIAMPPGTPKAAVDAMRTALAELNNDKEYAAEALKVMKFVPHYETSPDINTRVRKNLTVSPEVRTFVLDYMKKKH